MWRLVTAPFDNPGVWTVRIAPSPHFYMTGMACFADYFVIEGREDGLDQIEIHSYDPAVPPRRIAFPEASYAAGLGSNPEYARSEEHTSELQSLMRISYAVFCLKKNNTKFSSIARTILYNIHCLNSSQQTSLVYQPVPNT